MALSCSCCSVDWTHDIPFFDACLAFTLFCLLLTTFGTALAFGFVGVSVSVETGDTWFVGAGVGRTNLRNYANLNFDPNDAWMLSGGYRWASSRSLAVQVVRDYPLNPDQQNVHLVYRTPINGDYRLTLDLLQKKGLVGGVPISRSGLSVAYDWPRYFVHVAWDPQVNFTTQDMLRL